MTHEPKSIADHIDCLARLTGAPNAFVHQVRTLFTRKGINLADDADPYLPALEEAFRREESIRSTSRRARQSIAQIHENFQRIGRAYVEQISRLRKIQTDLRDQAKGGGQRDDAAPHPRRTQVTIRGDHRTFVTRPEREQLPMVPGPKDLQ